MFLKSVRCSLSDHSIVTMAKGFYVDRLSFSYHVKRVALQRMLVYKGALQTRLFTYFYGGITRPVQFEAIFTMKMIEGIKQKHVKVMFITALIHLCL